MELNNKEIKMDVRINGLRLELLVVALGMGFIYGGFVNSIIFLVIIGAIIMLMGVQWYLSKKGYVKSLFFSNKK